MIISIEGNENILLNSLISEEFKLSSILKENNNDYFKTRFNEIKRKIRVIIQYKKNNENKTDFQKIKYLRYRNVIHYAVKCEQIAKDIKGIYFDKNTLKFRVQFTYNKQRYYVGQYDDLDLAIKDLNENKKYFLNGK
jgi:hypothetical protein